MSQRIVVAPCRRACALPSLADPSARRHAGHLHGQLSFCAAQIQNMLCSNRKSVCGILAGPVRCCYRLDLQTTDLPGSRLAGSATVALVGELGAAGPFELSAGSGSRAEGGARGSAWSGGGVFERGSLDSYLLEGLPDLGTIQEASPCAWECCQQETAGQNPSWGPARFGRHPGRMHAAQISRDMYTCHSRHEQGHPRREPRFVLMSSAAVV